MDRKLLGFFFSGLKFSVSVGVLGAVGVLAIKVKQLVEFGPLDRIVVSSRHWSVPGLENLGSNCFLNVVLQALSSCSFFRKYLREMVDEYRSFSEGDEDIPLVAALASVVEELCTVCHERTVLSPRKVMFAIDHYIPNFNLTRQQDAEEAFSHLLSSLREEISEHCVPIKSYLSDLPSLPNGRIISRKRNDEENEWQRWGRCFLRPFDGILGSILICQSCSFQISLEFQLFHSLHLSPPMNSDATVRVGCTLEDCLKRFFTVERVENYFCSNCWHVAAIEYLSAFSEKKDVERVQCCHKDNSCECKALPSLQAFPWLNRFSCTFKKMSIAQSPKILCVHLQRASYDMLGQSIKLLGHVSFPLILDLSSFMSNGVGLKNMDLDLRFGPMKLGSKEIRPYPYFKYPNMLVNLGMPNSKTSHTACFSAMTDAIEERERNTTMVESGLCLIASEATPTSDNSKEQDDHNAEDTNVIVPSATPRQMYRLVSVVEHFGMSGSGHYMVYRKVTGKLGAENHVVCLLESATEQWFCISDSQVQSVTENDVLSANASILFYEKIG